MKLEDTYAFAENQLLTALRVAEEAAIPTVERFSANSKKSMTIEGSLSIADDPRYKALPNGHARNAHAVVLAVDLRCSTWYAQHHGPRNTFSLLHTFLPTMEYIVDQTGGVVIGLRGDGLIAGFGLTDVVNDERVFTTEKAERAASSSVRCGKAMVESMESIINPLLEEYDIPADRSAGVGITTGQVVITRIGIENASEVTAYGSCLNQACKNSDGNNQVFIHHSVESLYPTEKGGPVRFSQVRGKHGWFNLSSYPYDIIEGSSAAIRRRLPR